MKLIFDIHGTKIKRIDDLTLTSYTRNTKCLFHFSCEWSDVYKYALFIDVNGNQYLLVDPECLFVDFLEP